jgi:signal transduction histidine kinase
VTFRWQASCLLAPLVCAAVVPAQDLPVIRVNVNLVHALATVRNPSGDLVGGLGKGEFRVYDNGVPQEIAVFERQTNQPLSVALLIDTSGSTNKEMKYETDSATRFLHALLSEGNPDDAVALYTFNYAVTLQHNFTRNYGSLERVLRTLHGDAGTSLYDAIWLAAQDLELREGRKVMIIVTDGGETTSSKNSHQALQAAQSRLLQAERLATIGQMSTKISHEVRNPLSSISLNLELLEDELGALPDGRRSEVGHLVKSMRSQVDVLSAVTEGYLRFARLPKARLEMGALAPVIEELADFVREELRARKVDLFVKVEEGLPQLCLDPGQIRQAQIGREHV